MGFYCDVPETFGVAPDTPLCVFVCMLLSVCFPVNKGEQKGKTKLETDSRYVSQGGKGVTRVSLRLFLIQTGSDYGKVIFGCFLFSAREG